MVETSTISPLVQTYPVTGVKRSLGEDKNAKNREQANKRSQKQQTAEDDDNHTHIDEMV